MVAATDLKKHRHSLGKGLSALLGENLVTESQTNHMLQTLPVRFLKPGVYQPRKKFDDEKLEMLVDSIREKGIIQPLVVRPLKEIEGYFEIIAGERRWRAAKILNLENVPIIIRDCDDKEALETALIENIQRDDLSPIEEAEAYQRLLDEFSYTQEQLARAIGKSRSHVANMLRLNTLPENIKELVHDGKISAGHARTLINKDNIDGIVEKIIDRKLNVREAERLAQEEESPFKEVLQGEQMALLEQQISELLDTKVELMVRNKELMMSIFFRNIDEIDHFIERVRK